MWCPFRYHYKPLYPYGYNSHLKSFGFGNRMCMDDHGCAMMPKTPLVHHVPTFLWVNYNDLTATSLEIMVSIGNDPQMALIQVSEVFAELDAFWQPYWTRQDENDGLDFQNHFGVPSVQFPAMDDSFETSLSDWKEALATCNNSSSPGVDGFNFRELKMLPDPLLKMLVDIVHGLEFFPSDFMLARTIPIPKKEKLSAENSRPITVLSTIYRLWGKVCGKRCLRHLADKMSPAIAGLLPKRGAHDASYNMQAKLELLRSQNEHVTGVTLDLLKCFNLLRRSKVSSLMLACGIPKRLVDKWARSIDGIRRFWDVANMVSTPAPTTCGCPERDSWSVTAILCVAETWCRLLSTTAIHTEQLAYADNWSVWMPDQQLSAFPIQQTCKFVDWMGLAISWNKTWFWSTGTTGTAILQTLLQHQVPIEVIPVKLTATDLGCQMTYHGTAKLGLMHERFEDAKRRLEVVKHSTWPLPLKAHLIRTAILPLAMYGGELLTIGQKPLNNLRTAIADALVGESVHTMSSSLFVHCVSTKDLDPNVIAVLNAVKCARKLLRREDQEFRGRFLHLVSRPSKHQGLTQGPASALREYLRRLDLTCAPNGDIQVNALRFCNLLETPFKDLHRYIQWAWQDKLLLFETQRTKLYNLPPIDKEETARLLSKLKPKQQLLVLREIAGAFQTNPQKAHWTDVDVNCQFCNQEEDSRFHRAFSCVAFQEGRHPDSQSVQSITETLLDLHELPVVHMHPQYEFLDALWHAMPEVIITQEMKEILVPCDSTDFTFYTDGSCFFQSHRQLVFQLSQ